MILFRPKGEIIASYQFRESFEIENSTWFPENFDLSKLARKNWLFEIFWESSLENIIERKNCPLIDNIMTNSRS